MPRKPEIPRRSPRRERRRRSGASRKPARRTEIPLCEKYRDVLLDAVREPIEGVPPATGRYRLMLAIAAVMLILTPTAYFLLVAGGFLSWSYHLLYHLSLLQRGVIGWTLYLVPAVTGPFVLIFLVQPLFAKTEAYRRPRMIKEEAEPFLYEFVETLCESLGAPVPTEIRLSCDVNASAGFTGGLLSIFSTNMCLTIGLPLVHGLTPAQLSSVLVHEFGHFSQQSGMRISYFARTVSNWIGHAASGNQTVDAWLYEKRHGGRIFAWIFWTGISVGALIAKSLMMWIAIATNALSYALLRQMEFDADRIAAIYVGVDVFAETQKRITRLSVAEQLAMRDLEMLHTEGRLVDDFPRLIASSILQIDRELDRKVMKHQRATRTQIFDTHPSDRERLASVKRWRGQPFFTLPDQLKKARASILFRRIDVVSRGATLEFYKNVLGPKLKKDHLLPTELMMERQVEERDAQKALKNYLHVEMPPMFPIPLSNDALEPAKDIKTLALQLLDYRNEMTSHLKKYRRYAEHYEHAEDCQMQAAAAVSMLHLGVAIRGKHFGLSSNRRETAEETLDLAEASITNISEKMLNYESAAGSRLSCAMRLALNDRFYSKLPDQRRYDNLEDYIQTAFATADLMAIIRPIRLLCHRVIVVFAHLDGNAENPEFLESLFRLVHSLHKSLQDLSWEMGGYHYPFDHADEYATIQTYALPDLPEEGDIGGMLAVSQMAFSNLATLQMRVFARLTHAAEGVEEYLGLDPVVAPT